MKIEQKSWHPSRGWEYVTEEKLNEPADLVWVFGPAKLISDENLNSEIRQSHPSSDIIFISAIASIFNGELNNDIVCLTAVKFTHAKIECLQVNIDQVKDSFDAGAHISAALNKENLKYLMIFSDSYATVNGNQLLTGINFNLSHHIPITGGMASASPITESCLSLNGIPAHGNVIAIGFSGEEFEIGSGFDSGWTPFGSERFITKAQNNKVQKIDDNSPFEFYTDYLEGIVDNVEKASREFPLGIRKHGTKRRVIRDVVEIDKSSGDMTFAGDFEEGDKVRMMKTNITQLIDSAQVAAKKSTDKLDLNSHGISFVVNCMCRYSLLNDWAAEELSAIQRGIKNKNLVFGFYSSGEITPFHSSGRSELQNQTIVVTSFKEN